MKIGIIDADLLSRKRHRFPNLVSMKLSGYYKKQGYEVELITNYNRIIALDGYAQGYDKIFVSKVFTDTVIPSHALGLKNAEYGGTGFFYDKAPALPDWIEHHMPDYHLYDKWVQKQIEGGKKSSEFVYYTDYSIGFLTRGCFRHCDFCVNKNYNRVFEASPIEEFYDPTRKKICLLDDNFFGCSRWRELFKSVQDTGRPFQFKQGLDERIITEEKCEALFKSKYDGDFIFAFDNLKDRETIEKNLDLMRKYTNKVLKFYVFCGFDREGVWNREFWKRDIATVFIRTEILFKHRAIPYMMRFNRINMSPYKSIYTSIARWINQPRFLKSMSFREFCHANGENSAAAKALIRLEGSIGIDAHFLDMKWGDFNGNT